MKLQQNRAVVVGRNPMDASTYARESVHFKDCLESPALLNSASHRLAIPGSIPSSVGAVYITQDAPEGENFDVVLEALERVLVKNPNLVIVEEPRTVHA